MTPDQVEPPTEWLTLTELALRRGDMDGAPTGSWVYRQLQDRALIAVEDRDAIRVPAFMVTADGEPRPELRPVLHVLRAAGIDGRTAATWLTSRSDDLSGGVPEQVARTDRARAAQAAARFATEAETRMR